MRFGGVGLVGLAERQVSPLGHDARPPVRSASLVPLVATQPLGTADGKLNGASALLVPSLAAGLWATIAGIAGQAFGTPLSTEALIAVGTMTFLPLLVVVGLLANVSGDRSE